ncbi:MAG: ABC-F family ATP-binding cassette domain-containing protein [Candidatus Latescibacterota bacterium]
MSLLTGSGIAKSYAHRHIFADFTFAIEHGDRIGLVGINGGGKTTLLRIIAGLETSTPPGQIHRKKGLQVGYLAQDAGRQIPDGTMWETMLEGVADLRRLEAELQDLAARLTGVDDDPLLARYSVMQADFERRDGYLYETRIRTVLAGLGFDDNDHDTPLSQLSGGQRTRVQLARLLVEGSELLLLDEPTNYLDLRAVEWLEGWLRDRDGSYLVVSHDRWFLDHVTQRTWEIAFGRLEAYRGAYSAYVRQRQERYERRVKEWETQQAYVEKTEEYVRRFLAGQRTREAQGRRKRLQRFLRDEAIEKPQQHRRMRLRLESSGRTGDIVLRLTNLALGYGSQSEPVVRTTGEVEAHRGQRVAVIGPNGSGKTTLVRSILGELKPLAGEVRLGAKVETGYLPQTQDYLDGSRTLAESLDEVAPPGTTIGELRDLLGSFLFSGDDVDKRVEQVSGGERSRVALARLVLQGANFLILDEPTNHLDIASQEVLEDVLADFAGTVMLVSHDRYLIQSLATRIWVVEDGDLTTFDGNWSQYCEWRERRSFATAQQDGKSPVADDRENRREARRQRKAHEQRQERHVQLEAHVANLEERKADLGTRIGRASEARNMDLLAELISALQQVEADLEQGMAQWEEIGQQLEGY